MINKDKIFENVKLKISISSFNDEEMTEKKKSSRSILKVAVVACCMITFTTGIVVAVTQIIKYNPFNGKPIIVAGEEIPEELIGEEVALMIPPKTNTVPKNEVIGNITEEINVVVPDSNVDKEIELKIQKYKELEEDFDRIMYKYHGKEKIDKILVDMNNENSEIDYGFPESGKTLLYCVIEIFDTMNPTEEEKQVLREFSQMMVVGNSNKIDDEELIEKINDL